MIIRRWQGPARKFYKTQQVVLAKQPKDKGLPGKRDGGIYV
jgi:hypothetical protein